jgi:hypothetical protein
MHKLLLIIKGNIEVAEVIFWVTGSVLDLF